MAEFGSFNWYEEIPEDFFRTLIKAIQHADLENKRKLKRIFPHICAAHEVRSWDVAPSIDCLVTLNVENPDCCAYQIGGCADRWVEREVIKDGTFLNYLKRSGHFVTYMAETIVRSDVHNRKLISLEYPQMIAAFEAPTWNMVPPGFRGNTYDSL